MSIQPLEGSLGSSLASPFSSIGEGAGSLSASPISPGDAISRIAPPWLTNSMSNPMQTAMLGPIPGLLQQLVQLMQQLMGSLGGSAYGGDPGCSPYGGNPNCTPYGNEQYFTDANGGSAGDPHLSFNGRNAKLLA
ncbi:MAG TPA: hypothetical protein VJP76_06120 [Candidatus Tumulicola sp.]|nr:hypothetical protein [Candidatus Tumulicola sp.]